MAITATEARARLFPLIEQVNDDHAAIEITSKRGTAFLVSEDEYLSLRETVHLLRSPRNAQRLHESIAESRGGAVRTRDLLEAGPGASTEG